MVRPGHEKETNKNTNNKLIQGSSFVPGVYLWIFVFLSVAISVQHVASPVYAQERTTLSTADQQYQNLVANGDFEYWSGGRPFGWNDISGAAPSYTQDNLIKRINSYSVKLTSDAGTTSKGTYQRIAVEPNTTYTFSCYFYSALDNQAELEIDGSVTQDLVNRTGVNALTSTNGVWKRFAASFTTGTDTYVDIKLYAKADSGGQKSAYFDGIILTQGPMTVAFSPQAITEKGGQAIYGDLTLKGDIVVQGGEVKITGLPSAPSNPSQGTVYFNTTDSKLYVYNGTTWVDLTIQGITYSAGNDLDLTENNVFNIEPQLDYVSTISRDGGNLTLKTITSGDIVLSPATGSKVNVTGNIVASGTITQSRAIYFIPNYENALIKPDGTLNRGTLKTSYLAGRSFYEWTTNEPTAQDCDIVVRIRLPDGALQPNPFDPTEPIKVYNRVSSASGNTKLTVSMFDTNGSQVDISGNSGDGTNELVLKNTDWTESIITIDATGKTFEQGGWITLNFELTADQNETVDLGELTLKGNW